MTSQSNDDLFDFGFTAVDESELDSVDKLTQLKDAILPLLQKLKENPEKDYIYWPNRVEKIESFERRIQTIISS